MSVAIGNRLIELRKNKGLSQTQLSKLTKIQNVTISKYENGQQEPEVKNLKRLAQALETSVDYILFGNDENVDIHINYQNHSEGYIVAKEILDLYKKGFVDFDDIGNGYLYNIYGIRDFLTSYKAIMGEECSEEEDRDNFIEKKIKKFADKYDSLKNEEYIDELLKF